jgi:tRNA-2-methylthio-N6-dimethylallyladenosine synthase
MGKNVYIETYGCQMNLADSETVLGLLDGEGYQVTNDIAYADVILVNTCSIRENAEQRIYGRLGQFKRIKKEKPEVLVGVLGCMAERLRDNLTGNRARGVGQIVDLIVGPDEYRKVPELISRAWHGEKGIAVKLSRVETYDDITPLRTNGISAWISVMRGCDKFCTFCVVPFTRGRERSRSMTSIVCEVEELSKRGFKEVTLLGQNVNSYRDDGHDFADLLTAVAGVDRSMRVRFTTSHPQDMSDKLIGTIVDHPNICNYVHLPVQSGSDRILELMNRTYDSTHYLRLVEKIRKTIPGVSLSTDVIAGFPTETEEDHRATLDLMEEVQYDGAFMFKYSARENTPAWKMGDVVPDEVKTRWLQEIIELQARVSNQINRRHIGETFEVLVEGESKKSKDALTGRTDTNKIVVFPRGTYDVPRGKYVNVRIVGANSATLFGTVAEEFPDNSSPEGYVVHKSTPSNEADSFVHMKEMV